MKTTASHLTKFSVFFGFIALQGAVQGEVISLSVTNTLDGGTGSLREAMQHAVQNSVFGGPDYLIVFDIPGISGTVKTIRPGSPLPEIKNWTDLTIDGTTQAGYSGMPLIEISGENAGGGASGFSVSDGSLTVRGLAINRFGKHGIHAWGDSLEVTGCRIGTNVAGTAAAGNGGSGIYLFLWPGEWCRIGEPGGLSGNVISGNGENGIEVWASGDSYTYTDGWKAYASILNNKIGTNLAGTSAIPNGGDGIKVSGVSTYSTGLVEIGGASPGARNLISGNVGDGVNGTAGYPINVVVHGNLIGLASNGSGVIGNGGDGIEMSSRASIIGGGATGEGNVISGNGESGIETHGIFDEYYPATEICGNLIGTNVSGDAARGNAAGGILCYGDVKIGGAGKGNVIAGNVGNGVRTNRLTASYDVPSEVELTGNLIGVTRLGSPLGNSGYGVRAHDSYLQLGGAATSGDGNVIGANLNHGVYVTGESALFCHGNWIGVTATGGSVGNGGDGVRLFPYAGDPYGELVSQIGGTGVAMANRIAYNGGRGVALPEVFGVGAHAAVLGNSIWSNGELGIDLGLDGVTANDRGDTDGGANNRQNAPVLTLVSPTRVGGTIGGAPGTPFRVECFRVQADGSGHGEGRWFLGAVEVVTGTNGEAEFLLPGLNLQAGQAVTATATRRGDWQWNAWIEDYLYPDILIDTSEFAANVSVGAEIGDLAFSSPAYSAGEGAGVVSLTVVRTGAATYPATVDYCVEAGSAEEGLDFGAVSGTLNFAAGVSQANIAVPLMEDGLDEPEETFEVVLSAPTGGALVVAPSVATVTIVDNDSEPFVSVSGGSVFEGDEGMTVMGFDVVLSAVSAHTVVVEYEINSGTAEAGSDFEAVGGSVEFTPGESSKAVLVQVVGDTLYEADETLTCELFDVDYGILGTALATGTIVNDDMPDVVEFAQAAVALSESSGVATLVLTRTGGALGEATVGYGLAGGTASGGEDYRSADVSGVVIFSAGQAQASVSITLYDDGEVEGPETLELALSNPSYGVALGVVSSVVLTLEDDDTPPSVSGRVTTSGGEGMSGVPVVLSGDQTVSTVTAPDGSYELEAPSAGGGYTLSVEATGWVFEPAERSYPSLSGALEGQDFVGEPGGWPEFKLEHREDGTATVSWAATDGTWLLQRSPDLTPGSWVAVVGRPVVKGGWTSVTLGGGEGRAFFRLAVAGNR